MILDAIIGLFVSLFTVLAEGVAVVFIPIVNLIAAAIEMVVGIFVSGFRLRRLERKTKEERIRAAKMGGPVMLLIVILFVTGFAVIPKVINREVTLVAKEGHALPFAALIIHTAQGDRHQRTDRSGNIVIPRFGTRAVTVKDPRYVEQTWVGSEIGAELTVRRTVLGSGLDSFAHRLLRPAKE